MATFQRTLGELFEGVDPASVLDVGCGEAILTHQWALARPASPGRRLRPRGPGPAGGVGAAHGAQPRVPDPAAAGAVPFAEGEFALATAIEVLEHVPDPEHTVAEMARCARGGHLLVSVPREPLWRGLNIARGRVPEGPRQHARAREPLVQAQLHGAALRGHGRVVEAASPFPWTMLLTRMWRRQRARASAAWQAKPRRASGVTSGTAAARASSRSASRRPGSSPSRTSRSRRTS